MTNKLIICPYVFNSCLIVLSMFSTQAMAAGQSLEFLQQQYQETHTKFAAEMNSIADYCEANSFFTDAERIRLRTRPISEGVIDLDNLPTQQLPELPKQMSPVETEWRTRLKKLEEQYAIDLYRLARQAMKKRHASFAFQLVRELVYHDPDHQFGRQLLGYVSYKDEWTTPFSRSMRSDGYEDHPTFGWIRTNQRERFEQGERLYRGRWMSLEKEEALRKEFRNGWEIKTEHFSIKTNHSLEKGVKISRQLELFHDFFIREFAAFFSTPLQMQKLFGAGATSKDTKQGQHQIYYFTNREEFVSVLKAKRQNTLIATGFYLPDERTSFFYHDDNPDQAEANQETMYHEVTHQLLGESSSRKYDVGEHSNFWVIEGIACYTESFEMKEPTDQLGKASASIGDPTHPRIYWARRKAIVDDFFIPMERFTLLGKRDFQAAPDSDTLHAYYSQATGMVHFFLHYREGLYRDAFIDYLSQVYSPVERIRENPKPLDMLTEVPFAALNQQYLDYLRELKTQ